MQCEMPFFESPEDALRDAVRALGGAKRVAGMLWPDKMADDAARQLLDCLNHERPAKLDLTQVMFVLRHAREAGFHASFVWLAAELGYEARPVTREDEIDRLTSVVEHSTKALASAIGALERIKSGSMVGKS